MLLINTFLIATELNKTYNYVLLTGRLCRLSVSALKCMCATEDRESDQCCQLSDFVAIFSYFLDPPSDKIREKRLATNLVTFWVVRGSRITGENIFKKRCRTIRQAGRKADRHAG